MRAIVWRREAQFVGVSIPLVNEEKCGEIVLEPTTEYPLGYGSGTCRCGEVFDLYVRSDAARKKASWLPFFRGSKLVLTLRGNNNIALHTAKLVDE